MKQLLLTLLLLACVAQVSAVPLVRNEASTPTSEDSISFIVQMPDSLGNVWGNLDTLKVLVLGPGGDSVFSEKFLSVTGRLARRNTGVGAYDTTYVWRAKVSDIDGTGAVGVYTVRFTAFNSQGSRDLTFQSKEQFQILPVRPSVWANASGVDSAGIEHAAYDAIARFSNDSTIVAETLITQLLDSMLDRGYTTGGGGSSITVADIFGATASSYNTAGTIGALINWAGDPDNYPSITELIDSTWGIGSSARLRTLLGAQAFALTGNITGNLSGSVGSVTGNVGGNVNGNVNGTLEDISNEGAEHIAAVVRDSGNANNWDSVGAAGTTVAGRSGPALTSLDEIQNPFFVADDTTRWSAGATTTYSITDGTQLSGWDLIYYSYGTGTDNSIVMGDSTGITEFDKEEGRLTGQRVLQLTDNQINTGTTRDSFVLSSNYVKLYPGYYKFGMRHRVPITLIGNVATVAWDSVTVQLRTSAGVVVASAQARQDLNYFWPTSNQIIISDTATYRLVVRGSVTRNSGESAKLLQISQAFLSPMSYNQWAVTTNAARVIPGSMGDSLQKAQSITVDVDEAAVASAVWSALLADYYSTAGSAAQYLKKIDSVARAIVDSVNGISFGDITVECAGTGAYGYSIALLDTSAVPDAVVPGTMIQVNNLAQSAQPWQALTDEYGVAYFNLDTGSYIVFTTDNEYAPETDTITITGTGSHTLEVRASVTTDFASLAAPTAFAILKPDTSPNDSARINIELVSVNDSLLRVYNVIVASTYRQMQVRTNMLGEKVVNLFPNVYFTNDSTYYRATVRNKVGETIIDQFNFRVPVSDTTIYINNLTRWDD